MVDSSSPVEPKGGKKRVVVKRSHETTDIYEIDASDSDDEILTRIVTQGHAIDPIRLALGVSVAGNLILLVELLKTIFQLPYSQSIQDIEAVVAIALVIGGIIWSRRGVQT